MTRSTQSVREEKSAARRLAETFSAETLDSLIKDAVKSGTPIDGAEGLLNELTKAVLERALQALVDAGGHQLRQHQTVAGRRRSLQVGQQDQELVAAQARDQVHGPRVLAHDPGHLAKQLVPGEMAAPVVNFLEVV